MTTLDAVAATRNKPHRRWYQFSLRTMLVGMVVALLVPVVASAQPQVDRNKARELNQLGWEYMRSEKFDNAITAFQKSVEIDPGFDMPWYGLGRAHLALKQFVSAISALNRCKDLYVQQVGRQFTNQQEAQRVRQDRLAEIDEMIRDKQQLADKILGASGEGESLLTEMSDQDLLKFVSLDLTRAAEIRYGRLNEAERQLAAATADVGAATAELYPKVNLTAFLGLQNTKLNDFTPVGKSWAIAGGFSTPIFGRTLSAVTTVRRPLVSSSATSSRASTFPATT